MSARKAASGPVDILILAAGQGKRMRSRRVKLLHRIAGAPMVCHVARAAAALKPGLMAAVVGNQADEVRRALESGPTASLPIRFVTQSRQLGTGHAVMQARRLLEAGRKGRRGADLLILNGDVPLLRPSTLKALLRHHRRTGAVATALTTLVENPSGYGRVIRGARGEFEAIVEQRDATASQARIKEINAGLYCADRSLLFEALGKTGRDNAQGEHYLPDLFPILRRAGRRVEAYLHSEVEEVLGVNDRAELAAAGKRLYRRRAEELMEKGVTVIDPDCTYVDPDVRVGADTILYPMVHLEGGTIIGKGCSIGTLAHIVDSKLGDGVQVLDSCVITDSRINKGARVGPFSHLRPGATLDDDVHVGNFVEVKKARLGKGSKANHLSYLGDAEIGRGCNIGAGTITCNYDGELKHKTTLEDGVFIGSDTQLVAPVKVGRGAYVGAGSTITKEVPRGALALTRVAQRNHEGWVKRRKKKGSRSGRKR